MSTLKKLWRWARRSWVWIALFGVVTTIGWVVFGGPLRKKPNPLKKVKDEMRVINGRRDAVKAQNAADAAAATAQILTEHQDKVAALDEKEKDRVEELKDDPEMLADYLLRLGA